MSEQVSKEQALELVRAVKFQIDQESQAVLHVFRGGLIGADWDIENVEALIARADEIAWRDHLLAHDLTVLADGKVYNLDVADPSKQQERAAAEPGF